MVQILPAAQRNPTFAQKLSAGVGRGLEMGSQLMEEHKRKKAIEDVFGEEGKNIANLPPEFQQLAYKAKLEKEGRISKTAEELQSNRQLLRSIEKERNLEPGSLEGFVTDPSMAASISKPEKEKTKRLSEMPIDPEQKLSLEKARSVPGFNEMDEIDQYNTMIDFGVSPELSEKQAKLKSSQLERKGKEFESSYKAQENFINETTNKYRAFETETKPRLLQMQNIPDEEIIGPTSATFLETLGIPLGALEDPSSELYQKLSLDLLKGLPETYGNRIMKVEVDNFLKTIPSLLNSSEGRRMIASNMLKLGEMKEIYYNEMRKQQQHALDNRSALPRDFQQRVFDQVKPQIDRVNNEFVKLSEIKHVPKNTIPFFSPVGEIEFVPKEHAQWAMENGGKRIW